MLSDLRAAARSSIKQGDLVCLALGRLDNKKWQCPSRSDARMAAAESGLVAKSASWLAAGRGGNMSDGRTSLRLWSVQAGGGLWEGILSSLHIAASTGGGCMKGECLALADQFQAVNYFRAKAKVSLRQSKSSALPQLKLETRIDRGNLSLQ